MSDGSVPVSPVEPQRPDPEALYEIAAAFLDEPEAEMVRAAARYIAAPAAPVPATPDDERREVVLRCACYPIEGDHEEECPAVMPDVSDLGRDLLRWAQYHDDHHGPGNGQADMRAAAYALAAPSATPVPRDETGAVDVRTLPEWDALVERVGSEAPFANAAWHVRVADRAVALVAAAAPLSPPVPKPDDEPERAKRIAERTQAVNVESVSWAVAHLLRAARSKIGVDAQTEQVADNAFAVLAHLASPPAPPAAPPRDEPGPDQCYVCRAIATGEIKTRCPVHGTTPDPVAAPPPVDGEPSWMCANPACRSVSGTDITCPYDDCSYGHPPVGPSVDETAEQDQT